MLWGSRLFVSLFVFFSVLVVFQCLLWLIGCTLLVKWRIFCLQTHFHHCHENTWESNQTKETTNQEQKLHIWGILGNAQKTTKPSQQILRILGFAALPILRITIPSVHNTKSMHLHLCGTTNSIDFKWREPRVASRGRFVPYSPKLQLPVFWVQIAQWHLLVVTVCWNTWSMSTTTIHQCLLVHACLASGVGPRVLAWGLEWWRSCLLLSPSAWRFLKRGFLVCSSRPADHWLPSNVLLFCHRHCHPLKWISQCCSLVRLGALWQRSMPFSLSTRKNTKRLSW